VADAAGGCIAGSSKVHAHREHLRAVARRWLYSEQQQQEDNFGDDLNNPQLKCAMLIGEQLQSGTRMLLAHVRQTGAEEWLSSDAAIERFGADVVAEYEERMVSCYLVPFAAGGATAEQHASYVMRERPHFGGCPRHGFLPGTAAMYFGQHASGNKVPCTCEQVEMLCSAP
jgi:hypothetical protein